jgi:sulfite reductase (NADPH) flavoprotein alpha-component
MQVKSWVFQIHWFLGITAGLVLAVVGATGALLSFEKQIMTAISPGIVTVVVRDDTTPLNPDALLARFRVDHPNTWVEQITLSSEAGRSALVRVAAADGKARAQSLYIDPYTGEPLGTPNGQAFFRSVLELHRWLLVPRGEGVNIGRQITGICAIALIYFALSGLYMRWPRRPLNWRNWFRIDFSLKGRSFYWALHSVIGTWVLVVYLLLALTGLSWSYSWYKSGLSVVLTGEAPKERGEQRREGEQQELPKIAPTTDIAWRAFLAKTEGQYKTASISIPKKAKDAFAIAYVSPEALHDRQRGNVSITAGGEVTKFQPYAPVEPLGKRIYQGMYELHTGDWFGTPGRIVNMVASLLMPVFTITGFLLYLDRRKKKRHTKQASKAIASTAVTREPDYLVVYASQSGTSERLAWHTANILNSGGLGANVKSLAEVNADVLTCSQKALFLLSTFGEGEAPDAARSFIKKAKQSSVTLENLHFGLLALGDKCYRDYCGFAIEVEQWLISNGARAIFERINVDNHDENAIQQWEKEVAKLGGVTTIARRQRVEYIPWALSSRRQLNVGSVGNAIYSVELTPANNQTWLAGDILEIIPRQNPAKVDAFLRENNLDGNRLVNGLLLQEWLATHELPSGQQVQHTDLEALVASLKPLAKREYSIASLPSDGKVELVIRQAFDENGNLGLGSGWLTAFAQENEQVFAHVRRNPTFHSQDHTGPIIFIGTGTGIAGLRSHILARKAAGNMQNWLVFGERHRAQDRLYGDEFDSWVSSGILQRLDEVFSRDDGIYVQHRLIQEQARVREWLCNNAAIFICGSLTGMAAGVEQALIEIVGRAELDALRDSGRYKRDVY